MAAAAPSRVTAIDTHWIWQDGPTLATVRANMAFENPIPFFAALYAVGLALNYWYYWRNGAEKPC